LEAGGIPESFELGGCYFDFHGNTITCLHYEVKAISTNAEIALTRSDRLQGNPLLELLCLFLPLAVAIGEIVGGVTRQDGELHKFFADIHDPIVIGRRLHPAVGVELTANTLCLFTYWIV